MEHNITNSYPRTSAQSASVRDSENGTQTLYPRKSAQSASVRDSEKRNMNPQLFSASVRDLEKGRGCTQILPCLNRG